MMACHYRKEHIMASNKDEIIRCTPEEDAIINAQIAADPDDHEWTDEDFANALTYKELLAQYPELAAFDHHKARAALKRPEREGQRRHRH